MLAGKQAQDVAPESIAVQAGRDVVISGPSVSDVRTICELVWAANFPVLQEQAKELARQNMLKFSALLETRITAAINQVDIGRFSDPDVQASINDAVQASARFGERSNPEVLCSLITERLKNGDEFRDVVLAEAITVVPKLTRKQIAVLVLLHALLEMRFTDDGSTLQVLESFAQKVSPFCEPGTGLSPGQRGHLHYVGVCGSAASAFKFDIYSALAGMYPSLECGDGVSFKNLLTEKAPSYAKLVQQYESDRLFTMTIASVGSAIALGVISKVMSELEFDTWIF